MEAEDINNKSYQLSLINARKSRDLQKLINTLSNTTIGSLNSSVETLQAKVSTLENSMTTLQQQMNTLLSHTHNYEDDNGTTTTTKTTGEN